MKVRNILYMVFMILFLVLAYIFIDRGINTKTKILVNYEDNSNVVYKVKLNDNSYLKMNEKYASSLVDDIEMEFDYKKVFSTNINGDYSYYVTSSLITYKDDINKSISENKDLLINNKVVVIDKNDVNKIDLSDNIVIDYDKYRKELDKLSEKYNMELSGYLEVKLVVDTNLEFEGLDNVIDDSNDIKVIIPLSYDSFKINIINNNDVDSYYDFSKKQPLNYILLLIGAFCLSIGISFLILNVRKMIKISNNEDRYRKEIKKILKEHDDIIVNVESFYSKKMYNLIYVNSFKELMDVYKKIRSPISFKEIKKNSAAVFVMTDDESAWVYEVNSADINS